MNHWIVFFQPHGSEWYQFKMSGVLKDYLLPNSDVEKRDIAYHIAGAYGFCGWGFIRKIRRDLPNTQENRIYVELSFDEFRENILRESDYGDDPVLKSCLQRASGSFLRLNPKEINHLNDILRANGLESPEDVPEFEVRFGKFGFKDNTSFLQEAQRSFEDSGVVSVLFLDLDNFKTVNDDHGHDLGDKVIIQALNLIQQIVSPEGNLFHRSGDEILVLLPGRNSEQSVSMAERIRSSVEDFSFVTIGQGLITATIGIATFPDTCDELEKFAEQADITAMDGKKVSRNAIYQAG